MTGGWLPELFCLDCAPLGVTWGKPGHKGHNSPLLGAGQAQYTTAPLCSALLCQIMASSLFSSVGDSRSASLLPGTAGLASTLQYSRVHYSKVHCSTVQCNTLQYSAVQYSAVEVVY